MELLKFAKRIFARNKISTTFAKPVAELNFENLVGIFKDLKSTFLFERELTNFLYSFYRRDRDSDVTVDFTAMRQTRSATNANGNPTPSGREF